MKSFGITNKDFLTKYQPIFNFEPKSDKHLHSRVSIQKLNMFLLFWRKNKLLKIIHERWLKFGTKQNRLGKNNKIAQF